jgi:hypothetical protein
MASTTARTTNIIAVCPQNDLDAIRLNIRPFPHGMRFPTPSRPKAPMACTHKSRLVTATCQCPLCLTFGLKSDISRGPRSARTGFVHHSLRSPCRGGRAPYPAYRCEFSSAQAQAVTCVRRSALLVRSQHPSHTRRRRARYPWPGLGDLALAERASSP